MFLVPARFLFGGRLVFFTIYYFFFYVCFFPLCESSYRFHVSADRISCSLTIFERIWSPPSK